MVGMMEKMTMSDGAEVGVFHVQPEGDRRGGLVLVQEIFGVTDHIRDLAEEYAADGYEVLAPALFDREHPGFEADYSGDGLARGIELARQLHPFDLSLADVQSCIDVLNGPDGNGGPVFVVGYCYGGSIAWLAATRLDGLAAASSYYGSMVPATANEVPNVPVILHFGRHDHGIPMEDVEKVFASNHPDVTVHVYEAGPGFNSDRRKDYHEPSADLAKARTLELFAKNGG